MQLTVDTSYWTLYWLLSISVPKSNIEDGCISSFSSSTIHRIDGDTFLYNDVFPYSGTDTYVASTRRFSGSGYDQGAIDYIQKVKTTLADKTWMQAGFSLYR